MSLYYYYCPIIVDYLNFWLVVSPSGSAPAPLQVMPEELTSWKTHGPFTPAKECMMAWWAWFLIISYHTNSHHISSYHMYLYVFIIPQSIIIYISYHIYIYTYIIYYIYVCVFSTSPKDVDQLALKWGPAFLGGTGQTWNLQLFCPQDPCPGQLHNWETQPFSARCLYITNPALLGKRRGIPWRSWRPFVAW